MVIISPFSHDPQDSQAHKVLYDALLNLLGITSSLQKVVRRLYVSEAEML